MAVSRWNYFLQLLILYSSYYIRHSTCQEEAQQRQQQRPSNPYLLFYGILHDDVGEPVEDAQVQFWHADYNGNYFHPGDDLGGYDLLSDTFSYFGTAETDALGNFAFKTFRPGIYASRPITHIHFKVWHKNGRELLTSQFYFDDENSSLMFDEMLVLKLQESIQDDGNSSFYATKKVVVDMNKGGWDKLTPVQTEGPFYPLVNFFDVGNDMTAGLLNRSYGGTDEPTLESILSLSSAPLFVPKTVEPSSAPITTGNNNSNNITDGNSTDYDDEFVDFDSDEDVSSDENEEDESVGNETTSATATATATATTIIGDDDDEDEKHNDTDADTDTDNNDNNATEEPSSKPAIAPTEKPEKSKPENSKKTEPPTSNPTIAPTEKPKKTTPDDEIPVEPDNNSIEEEQEQKEEDPSVFGLPLEDNVSSSIKTSATINGTAIATDPGGSTRFLRSNQNNNNHK
jgi:protocatechuate 3,4-dioxygenase beta subunit